MLCCHSRRRRLRQLLIAQPCHPMIPSSSSRHPAEFHFSDSGHVMKHALDCTSYSGMQLAPAHPLLARLQRRQAAMVPGLAGGSFDEC